MAATSPADNALENSPAKCPKTSVPGSTLSTVSDPNKTRPRLSARTEIRTSPDLCSRVDHLLADLDLGITRAALLRILLRIGVEELEQDSARLTRVSRKAA